MNAPTLQAMSQTGCGQSTSSGALSQFFRRPGSCSRSYAILRFISSRAACYGQPAVSLQELLGRAPQDHSIAKVASAGSLHSHLTLVLHDVVMAGCSRYRFFAFEADCSPPRLLRSLEGLPPGGRAQKPLRPSKSHDRGSRVTLRTMVMVGS